MYLQVKSLAGESFIWRGDVEVQVFKSRLSRNFCSGPCKQNTGKNGPSGTVFIEQQDYLKEWCWLNVTPAEGEPLC